MDRRRPRFGLWRDVGRLAAVIGVLLVVYTLVIMLTSPGALLAWLSTLLSTVVSVLAALVVGLVLLQYQTRETDRKKAEELTGDLARNPGLWRSLGEKQEPDPESVARASSKGCQAVATCCYRAAIGP